MTQTKASIASTRNKSMNPNAPRSLKAASLRTLNRLRGTSGLYALILTLRRHGCFHVGALGNVFFPKGSYVYVGSAQNGVGQRILRHLRRKKPMFWHIDYLTAKSTVSIPSAIFATSTIGGECIIARRLGSNSNYTRFINRFGSSDCASCPSHLLYFGDMTMEEITQYTSKAFRSLGLTPSTLWFT